MAKFQVFIETVEVVEADSPGEAIAAAILSVRIREDDVTAVYTDDPLAPVRMVTGDDREEEGS